jgi:hypothetical protein
MRLKRKLMALYPKVEKLDPCPGCPDVAYSLDTEDKLVKDCEEKCKKFSSFNKKCNEMIAETIVKYKEE